MKIPIKRYVDDTSLTWEQRYERLLRHHEEETRWLIDEIKRLESELKR